MTAITPCYRHPRGVWLVSCPDCTAWYLPRACARRDDAAAAAASAAPVVALRRDAARRQAPGLRPAA